MNKRKKITIQELQRIAKSRGGKCLSKKYINQNTKLKWECSKGHQWYATPGKIKHAKRWCHDCGGSKPLTLKNLHKTAKLKKGKCLAKEYINSKTKVEWECSKGHRWFAAPFKVRSGTWCPKCIGRHRTIKDMQILAKERRGECLSDQYLGRYEKLKWKCEKNHEWFTAPYMIIDFNAWCPKCSKGVLSIEEMQDIAKNRGGLCLSKEYINARTKLKWQCEKGHVWKATPHAIKEKTWCPFCVSGTGENLCREVLEEIFQKPFIKKRHTWLRNPDTGYPLELDGYNSELNIAFEYNGLQHFKPIPGFKITEKNVEYIQRKDKFKQEFCKKHGIKLIVINQTDNLIKNKSKLKKRIIELLNKKERKK